MDLLRRGIPEPWAEGDNIPWNEPGFSERMLKEHLSQDHDAASRRFETIDRHAQFLHEQVLGSRAGRVLDMACGPGLYTHRLARLGHQAHGIDFAPAAIAYARQVAEGDGLDCTYDLRDLRSAEFGPDGTYDLAMFLYGEFHALKPADARLIVRKAQAALRPGGALVLEPSPAAWVESMGSQPVNWYSLENGLFADYPHMMLEESFWDAQRKVATNRYYVVDLATAQVIRYAASYQAYGEADFQAMLAEAGFGDIRFLPNLNGSAEALKDMFVIVARKQ